MIFADQNWIAIIVLSILWVIFGAIWYSPKVFGTHWNECCGKKEGECHEKGVQCWFFGFIAALVSTFVLSIFIHMTASTTFIDGAIVGFWAWLGFVGATQILPVIWEGYCWKGFFIHSIYSLISYVILGGILAIWM